MKQHLVAFLALALLGSAALAEQLGTAFTCQGRLTLSNSPASGLFDFQMALYDAPTSGHLLAGVDLDEVRVSNGLFTVSLDFGAAPFNGQACSVRLLDGSKLKFSRD